MSAFYFFKVELPPSDAGFDVKKAKRVSANQDWEMACYQIEKGLGFHNKMRQHKENVVNTQVVGYFYDEWEQSGRRHRECTAVPAQYSLKEGDKLILFRQALERNQAVHIPLSIRQAEEKVEDLMERCNREQIWQEMSEEDRIADMMSLDTRKTNFSGQMPTTNNHHSKQYTLPTGPPPSGYVCHRCMKMGHYKQLCPTLKDTNFIPMDRRRRTTGIPISMLRRARPDEHGWAWIHCDGSLMVPKNSQ